MFGLTFDKLLVIGVIAVFLLGPERLPHYAAQFARLIKSLRRMAEDAKGRMREEMGPDFDEVDWKKLDPRQYDPRRIIREALLDDLEDDGPAFPKAVDPEAPEPASVALRKRRDAGEPPPFDSEAT
ncbi:MAG TPA: sec-independent translocase [Microbacteriaceae bacterium]|jgi:Sec-independent protein secretion pathway components